MLTEIYRNLQLPSVLLPYAYIVFIIGAVITKQYNTLTSNRIRIVFFIIEAILFYCQTIFSSLLKNGLTSAYFLCFILYIFCIIHGLYNLKMVNKKYQK